MKAWVFVEGPADVSGLEALWHDWRKRLKKLGHGIKIIPLHDKSRFLKRFGERAAEKLAASDVDVVVGLPDLHPLQPESDQEHKHTDLEELKDVQQHSVKQALTTTQGLSRPAATKALKRLHASAFKHDFEMLLLAAKAQLREVLGTSDKIGKWREPVEDQNLQDPPKRVVEKLFRSKTPKKRAYRDTTDAPAVLRRVTDIPVMLRRTSGSSTCPEFLRVLHWMGVRLHEGCCDTSEFAKELDVKCGP